MSERRARTGLRTLVGLMAAMSLLLALTLPALAHHDPADGPEVAPTQEDFPAESQSAQQARSATGSTTPLQGTSSTVQLPDLTSATFKVISDH